MVLFSFFLFFFLREPAVSQSGGGGICSPALIVALKGGVVFLNLGLQSVFFGILVNVMMCSSVVEYKISASCCVTPAAAAEKSIRATRGFKVLSMFCFVFFAICSPNL